MEHETHKIVMDHGPDTEVLGRLASLEIADAAYLRVVVKYPMRNERLCQGEQIIKRHDGEPRPEPPKDPNLKKWSYIPTVFLMAVTLPNGDGSELIETSCGELSQGSTELCFPGADPGHGARDPVVAPVLVLARRANDQLLHLALEPRSARTLTSLCGRPACGTRPGSCPAGRRLRPRREPFATQAMTNLAEPGSLGVSESISRPVKSASADHSTSAEDHATSNAR
jgi:hypothetical protein